MLQTSKRSNEKCNIVRISDGLGNQLFQYAFGYSVYKRTGIKLVLDIMFISPLRHYQLDCFCIEFNDRYVKKWIDVLCGIGLRKAAALRLKYREHKIKSESYTFIKERTELSYDESIYKEEPSYYVGFWQSYSYFDKYYNDIKKQFVLKNPVSSIALNYSKDMKLCISVSCHIRRTDYNRNVNNVCLNSSYYKLAVERMSELLGGDYKLFIFTDDKEFVKQNFHFHEFTIVEGTSDLEDFYLMQQCRHHIIANSTFSWWGLIYLRIKVELFVHR